MGKNRVDIQIEPRIQKELDSINKIKESRYISRTELMEKVNFPENNSNLVVIKSNEKGIGFLKTCYDAKILTGTIRKEEFDGVIEKASNIIGNVYSDKRKFDSQGISPYYKLGLLISVALSFTFLVMAYYLPKYDVWYQVLTYLVLGVDLILISTISTLNFFLRTDNIETFEEMVYKKLGNYFEKLNATEYKSKGMEWYLVPGHYWLELRIYRSRRNQLTTEGNFTQAPNMDTLENRINTQGSRGGKLREELKE